MISEHSICLLNDSFPPIIDGVSNAVVNYARAITKKGGNAVVGTPKYPGADDSPFPFPVIRYPSVNTTHFLGYRAGYPFGKKAINLLKSYHPDIIHTHCPVISTMLARALRQDTGAPIILTYHTKFDIEINKAVEWNFLRKTAVKMLLNNIEACNEVWVVSQGAGENLKKLGYEGEYFVMENGVDFEKGRAADSEITRLRETHALGPDMPIFLFVGRMMWYKGIRLILDGLRIIADKGLQFKMLFVGDGAERKEIEKYCEEKGLSQRCVFVGAVRNRELLRTCFSCADLFVFPSSFDTNGIVVREAAACALPSVLLRGSCAAEGIEDGHTGLLIDETAISVANALERACKNPGMLRKIGQNAMNEIYVSWDEAVEKACTRYEKVIEDSCAGRLTPREVKFDELYALVSEVNTAVQRVQDVTSRIKNRIKDF